MEVIARAYLMYHNYAENIDKVYWVLLEKTPEEVGENEYVVRGLWGRRAGRSLKEQVKYRGDSYYEAEKTFTQLYHAKMNKGYALVILEAAQ